MTLKQLTVLLTTAALVAGQRPFFAGIRPIGYPEIITSTAAANDLGNRVGEDDGKATTVSTTTQRLPAEANGNKELVEQLSKLPIDQQPFWFINWQALEANRNKPQTYPQRPSQFAQPIGPNNPPIAPSNPQRIPISNTQPLAPSNFQPIAPSNPQLINNGNGNLGNRLSGPIAPSTNAPLVNKNGGDSNTNSNTEGKEPAKNYLAHNINVAAFRPLGTESPIGNRYGEDHTEDDASANYASSILKPVNDDSKENDEKVTATSKNPAVPSVSTPVKTNRPQNPLENLYGINSPPANENPKKSGHKHVAFMYPNPHNPYSQPAMLTPPGLSSQVMKKNPVPDRYTDDYEFETNIHPHGFKHNDSESDEDEY